MRKKLLCGSLILLTTWLMLCCVGCTKEAKDETSESFRTELDRQMIDTEKDTTIIIHTYGGDQHIARGRLDVIRNGSDQEETILELQGSIETKDNEAKAAVPETIKERGRQTVLTVYMNEQIYGFYSSHELHVDSDDSGNRIELYGYLEGYSDGNISY